MKKAVIGWGCAYLGYASVYLSLRSKAVTWKWMLLNGFLSFVLAMMLLPVLARTGNIHHMAQAKYYLFPSFFYAQDWAAQYFIAPFSHLNRAGDIVAVGFFSALGTVFYAFSSLQDAPGGETKRRKSLSDWIPFFGIQGLTVLTVGAFILLLYSRGTIVCVALVFFMSFVALALKFPAKPLWIFLALLMTISFFFFLWAGNLKSALKEVQTLEQEARVADKDMNEEIYKSKSIFMNQEGSRRAMRIYHDFSTWGVGTKGYKLFAKRYSSGGDYDRLKNPDATTMSHYYERLAEEGKGAWIYFAFLTVWFCEFFWKMMRTKSRFKFIAALSLAAPAVTILIHSSIIDHMERFTVSSFVYILMGAALAVLAKDFDHAS